MNGITNYDLLNADYPINYEGSGKRDMMIFDKRRLREGYSYWKMDGFLLGFECEGNDVNNEKATDDFNATNMTAMNKLT